VDIPRQSFEVAWASASTVDGWLTRDQARVLYDASCRVAPHRAVEIGSHLGRSTLVLAAGAAAVVAVDPFPRDWRYGREDTETRLRANLATASLSDGVNVLVSTSMDALTDWSDEIRLLYIDGKHDYWSCTQDLQWTRHLRSGDSFFVHDAFSSLGVTLALLRDQATSRRHRFLGRTGSLAAFEVAPPRAADRLRVARQLPWFIRNLVVKVLLRAGAGRLAAALGHHDLADPY
jgi:predicted O-methyltransferase YrrM